MVLYGIFLDNRMKLRRNVWERGFLEGRSRVSYAGVLVGEEHGEPSEKIF